MGVISKIEFGDFQTPLPLARRIVSFLAESGELPDTIIEPTCGLGSFVVAATEYFPGAKAVFGFDINPDYVRETVKSTSRDWESRIQIECRNFFEFDWQTFLTKQNGRVLIIGNPPWVTNSALSSMGSENLPEKSNFQGNKGFSAKTGKANFDISEWMLIRLISALHQREGCLAMLCKTSTARKTLKYAWMNELNIGRCSIHFIDAKLHFGASVDACLLVIHTGLSESANTAVVYRDLSFDEKISTIGLVGKELVSNLDEYQKLREIDGFPYYTWRSGIKHDAAGVMEFTIENGQLMNGKHQFRQIEEAYLYPLLKSSDVANGRTIPEKFVLLTQKKPSDDTSAIEMNAPKTWSYLLENANTLDQRKSIIYQKRPRFSVFGIGDYSFSLWKVAISSLYKNCRFEVVGSYCGKPVVLDDTCYFIPCETENEARFICNLLNSEICQRFLRSLIFFDAKRPVTIDILNRIDLKKVSEYLNQTEEAHPLLSRAATFENERQFSLVFEKNVKYLPKRGSEKK
ncbi:MAG: N-6 DNA methylase [Candidatus Neomarinimicrobiota bacterium]